MELLAPVGSEEMLEAVVSAGCNAVYMSGSSFGARAYADNFSKDQLERAVDYCHLRGVKTYITVNTILKKEEEEEAESYVLDLYKIGVDAILIQDMGLAYRLRQLLPDLPLHASTQMTLHDPEGAIWAEDFGFKRLVLARETPIEEIRKIREMTDIEIEVFCHGALCVSYSGNCYMSSLIGGRSGNRGRCAQICRKNYDLIKNGKKLNQKGADSFISPRDLMLIDDLQELEMAGVSSIKIEGRMKKPSYAYNAVLAYRKALDGQDFDRKALLESSNRPFTRGLIFSQFGKSYGKLNGDPRGSQVGLIRDKPKRIVFSEDVYKKDRLEFKTVNGKNLGLSLGRDIKRGQAFILTNYKDARTDSRVYRVFSEKNEKIDKNSNKIPVDFYFSARIDEKPELKISYKDYQICLEGDFLCQRAKTSPIRSEDVFSRLEKMGNSIYKINKIDLDLDEGIFFPLKTISQMRRHGIERLDKKRLEDIRDKRQISSTLINKIEEKPYKRRGDIGLSVNIDKDISNLSEESLKMVSRIGVFDPSGIIEIREKFQGEVYLHLADIILRDNLKYMIDQVKKYDDLLDGIIIENPSQIEAFRFYRGKKIAGSCLNLFNHRSFEWAEEAGFSEIIGSKEMSLKDLKENESPIPLSIIAFGPLVSMTMRHCPMSMIKNCENNKNCTSCDFSDDIYLKDEYQASYLIKRRDGVSHIFHHSILDLLPLLDKIKKTGISGIWMNETEDLDFYVKTYYMALRSEEKPQRSGPSPYLANFERGVE